MQAPSGAGTKGEESVVPARGGLTITASQTGYRSASQNSATHHVCTADGRTDPQRATTQMALSLVSLGRGSVVEAHSWQAVGTVRA